jgi:CheY-like chemotaxis protein
MLNNRANVQAMTAKILWADDEIDLLKPHILFLEERGYEVLTAKSGDEALELVEDDEFDVIFLDENMPGLSGLDTLSRIRQTNGTIPIIMITKSEEEEIMEEAIGSHISDYLIKPVNPNQILLAIKKNLNRKDLVGQKTVTNYQREFRNLGMRLTDHLDAEEWKKIYEDVVYWELQLERSNDEGMKDVLRMQKEEANRIFSRFVSQNYSDWIKGSEDAPTLSHNVLKKNLFPELSNQTTFLVVIDNLRLDQWKMIKPWLEEYFRIEREETYYAILPTATQYARNALFAGMMPRDIQQMFPSQWKNEDEEGSKNNFEESFLSSQLKREGLNLRMSYNKVLNMKFGRKIAENFANLLNNDLNVIVYNFVDMLSHARTEMEVIRELADDEAAYRSLTVSWFEHSPLSDILKSIAESGSNLVITTDHGSIRVKEPSKIVGDRNTNTNLRYKVGKNLSYRDKDVLAIRNPDDVLLPRLNVSSSYVFALNDLFFAYPNNYNYYVNYFRGTFQHGGISLEEIIVPYAHLRPR